MESKKKYFFLIAVSAFLLILSYVFAFSNTIKIRKEYYNKKSEESQFNSIPRQLQILSKKQIYYDSILAQRNLGNTSLENNLLKLLGSYSEKNALKLKEFNAPHIVELDNAKYTTYSFALDGSYNDLLKIIYNIEYNGAYGEVVHIDFQKETNPRTQRTFLTVNALIQNIQ